MFDMSWGEVLIIGAVALIVIGPKDLPKALRTLGNMTAKVRRMASEFQSQFNEAMREAELDDIKKQVSSINDSVSSLNTSFNPLETARAEIKGAIEAPPTLSPADAAATQDGAASLPAPPAFDAASEPTVAAPRADDPSVQGAKG